MYDKLNPDIKSILIIPDAHANPNFENQKRFKALGNYILHKNPSHVLCIGDLWDMPSLSFYDVGKRQIEGQRYEADIQAGLEAQELIWKPTFDYNAKKLKNHRNAKLLVPNRIFLTGNHCYRILRYVDAHATLFGKLSFNDLQLNRYWTTVMPFLKPYHLSGIEFQHYFTQGLMDRPMSGQNLAANLTRTRGCSAIQGHTHELQVHYHGRGQSRWGIVAGCYFDWNVDYVSEDAQSSWWRGITILQNVTKNGNFDPIFVPMHYLLKEYL